MTSLPTSRLPPANANNGGAEVTSRCVARADDEDESDVGFVTLSSVLLRIRHAYQSTSVDRGQVTEFIRRLNEFDVISYDSNDVTCDVTPADDNGLFSDVDKEATPASDSAHQIYFRPDTSGIHNKTHKDRVNSPSLHFTSALTAPPPFLRPIEEEEPLEEEGGRSLPTPHGVSDDHTALPAHQRLSDLQDERFEFCPSSNIDNDYSHRSDCVYNYYTHDSARTTENLTSINQESKLAERDVVGLRREICAPSDTWCLTYEANHEEDTPTACAFDCRKMAPTAIPRSTSVYSSVESAMSPTAILNRSFMTRPKFQSRDDADTITAPECLTPRTEDAREEEEKKKDSDTVMTLSAPLIARNSSANNMRGISGHVTCLGNSISLGFPTPSSSSSSSSSLLRVGCGVQLVDAEEFFDWLLDWTALFYFALTSGSTFLACLTDAQPSTLVLFVSVTSFLSFALKCRKSENQKSNLSTRFDAL